jgi:hypothetical protein
MDLSRCKDGVSVKPPYVKTLLLYFWLSTLLISVPCTLWQINLKPYREIARVPIVLSHLSQMYLIYIPTVLIPNPSSVMHMDC